ncbi:hypothetical protein ACJX0J_042314, partial [Zea mays]
STIENTSKNKNVELGFSDEEHDQELPNFPSFIPFLPPLSAANLKVYYATRFTIIVGIMVFGGFLAPIVSHSSQFWYSKQVALFMQQSTYRADALLLTTLIRVDKNMKTVHLDQTIQPEMGQINLISHGGGQDAMNVTMIDCRVGKFEAKFYHKARTVTPESQVKCHTTVFSRWFTEPPSHCG